MQTFNKVIKLEVKSLLTAMLKSCSAYKLIFFVVPTVLVAFNKANCGSFFTVNKIMPS